MRSEFRIRYDDRGVVQKLCSPLTTRIDSGLFLAAPRVISFPLDREEDFPWLSSPTAVLKYRFTEGKNFDGRFFVDITDDQ